MDILTAISIIVISALVILAEMALLAVLACSLLIFIGTAIATLFARRKRYSIRR